MPILSIPGVEAVRGRKDNRFANWGGRHGENRVEPFARPAFEAPFTFEPGEKIFTVGSCFARNVEQELVKRGFSLPMVDLFRTPAFDGLATWYANNYGTPSIYNEFAWAFGEEPFDEETAFVETSEGKFYDLSLHHGLKPGPIEDVRARRGALTAATRTLADCRVLVMTLGLVELWWDEAAGRYLNTIPPPSILNRWPERFAIHVLSFEESLDHLTRALEIAWRHARPDLRVILTVSPVPLMATHRPGDVMVANCYSKSVLRAVAEHVVMADERVVYFPSYESVTLSDRKFAWEDDFVHVTGQIVDFNVDRMVNAYTGAEERADYVVGGADEGEAEPEGALAMIEGARRARREGDAAFFQANAEWSTRSPGFRLEHAGHLMEARDHAAATALIVEDGRPEARLLEAEIALTSGDPERALEILHALSDIRFPGHSQWRMMIDAAVALRDPDRVVSVAAEWLEAARFAEETVHFHAGRALRKLGDIDGAVARIRAARPHFDPAYGYFAMEAAATFLDAGLAEEARSVLERAEGRNPKQNEALLKLRERASAA